MSKQRFLLSVSLLFFVNFIVAASTLKAESGTNPKNDPDKIYTSVRDWSFVENKGQLADEKGNQVSEIKYYGHPETGRQGGVYLYCKPGMLSFVFTKVENEPDQISEATGAPVSGVGAQNFEPLHRKPVGSSKISTSRADLILLNANPSAQILATDQQKYYENYYTPASLPGDNERKVSAIENVHTFKTIIYKNIYPYIDLVLYAKEGGVKYDFVVNTGGSVDDIKMQWNGPESIRLTAEGHINYTLALGTLSESKPFCCQDGKEIQSHFKLTGNRVAFSVKNYNKAKPLVIDPWIGWASYFGGKGNDAAYAIAAEPYGNVDITGYTESTSGIATSGAFNTSFYGYSAAFIAQFSGGGDRNWATYFNYSSGNAIALDASGNIYVCAPFVSPGGPADADIMVMKFDNSGTSIWYNYYYIKGNDYPSGIGLDASNNVYVTGSTEGPSKLATSGAYQTSYGGGSQDAFLAKFDTKGSVLWCTYFGGSGSDIARGIAVDGNSNIYITGETDSKSGIASSGAMQTYFAGTDNNAFLARFTASGSLTWATYYGKATDAYGIAADAGNNIYICGATSSDSGIATAGTYQSARSTYNTAFVTKFNPSGKVIWGTYFGGNINQRFNAITVDKNNRYIALAGVTQSDSGLNQRLTYQNSFGGYSDAFIAELSTSGSYIWSSYFGGEDNEEAKGIAVDVANNVFITGNTQSKTGIATPGAFKTNNSGPATYAYGDVFLAKFNLAYFKYDAGITGLSSPGAYACEGTSPVVIKMGNYGLQKLDSVMVSWSVNGKSQPDYKWKGTLQPDSTVNIKLADYHFNNFGTSDLPYTIKAWTSKPDNQVDSLNGNDTVSSIIMIKKGPAAVTGGNKTICQHDSITLGGKAITGHTYTWYSPIGPYNSNLSNPVVAPIVSTPFYLTEKDNATGCSKTDTVNINVNLIFLSHILGVNACAGSVVHYNTEYYKEARYDWVVTGGTITGNSDRDTVAISWPSGDTGNILVSVFDKIGCSSFTRQKIDIVPIPDIKFSVKDVCSYDSAKVIDSSSFTDNYVWQWGDGDSSVSKNPSHFYKTPGRYLIHLNASNGNGCKAENSEYVTVNQAPVARIKGLNSICAGTPLSLSDSGLVALAYLWHFGDGDSSVKSNPTHLYKKEGNFRTLLLVADPSGCKAADSTLIKVHPLPDASWYLTFSDSTSIFHANDSSYSDQSYRWQFGDPFSGGAGADTATGHKASHLYLHKDKYEVKLSVTNSFGCLSEFDSTADITVSGIKDPVLQHLNLTLYPNPFSDATSVGCTLIKPAYVRISINDMAGRELIVVLDKYQPAGQFKSDISSGSYHLSPGVYLMKIMIDSLLISKQLIKL